MERMALRSTEIPVLSRSGAGTEFLSSHSAQSLRETVRAFDHLLGCGCGLGAMALPNVASRVQASILHARPIRNSASFSERSAETMLASSSFNEGRGPLGDEGFGSVRSAWGAISANRVLRSFRFSGPEVEVPLGFVRCCSPVFLQRLGGSGGGFGKSQRRRQSRTSRSGRSLRTARSGALEASEQSPSRAEEAQSGTVRATRSLKRTAEAF
jgi:hypothetical protein